MFRSEIDIAGEYLREMGGIGEMSTPLFNRISQETRGTEIGMH